MKQNQFRMKDIFQVKKMKTRRIVFILGVYKSTILRQSIEDLLLSEGNDVFQAKQYWREGWPRYGVIFGR